MVNRESCVYAAVDTLRHCSHSYIYTHMQTTTFPSFPPRRYVIRYVILQTNCTQVFDSAAMKTPIHQATQQFHKFFHRTSIVSLLRQRVSRHLNRAYKFDELAN